MNDSTAFKGNQFSILFVLPEAGEAPLKALPKIIMQITFSVFYPVRSAIIF